MPCKVNHDRCPVSIAMAKTGRVYVFKLQCFRIAVINPA